MGKHSRKRSRSRSRERKHHHKKHRSQSPQRTKPAEVDATVTNLIDFTFFDHKHDLNRILMGYSHRDQLIENTDDFWLFLNKYENLLRRSGQCVLPVPKKLPVPDANTIPKYDKVYNSSLMLAVPFESVYSRLAYDHARDLTPVRVQQFLQIVEHYLDFKQKEKFNRLKKLRRSQANLPVAQYRDQIVEAVRNEQVVILAGDTGCGKSTQVPQYLYQAGFEGIVCTQPRRIACISLSKRVSHEMLCEYGTEVGYQIRFERSKSMNTKILFVTEGLLLRQLQTEEALAQYTVVILDEVHERHLHGDFLLGIAKCLLKAKPNLKIVLMSATINIKLFSDYFAEEQARIIEVPGRLYPIKLHYMPQIQDVGASGSSGKRSKAERLNPEPYIQIMQLIDNKYPSTEKGDMLVFLSGLNEIEAVVEAAKEYSDKKNNWIILPLHSSLSIADQDKVFDYAPDGMRKCVISTNIAETSVTIDGIRFVVDSGKVKEMSYDPECKMQRLKEFWISKASAEQRKGRAGRTGPGVCYRLFSEKTYLELESFSTAEIHKVPLESLLLNMISMGLPNARLFPFVEPPPTESIENAILSLKQHDALTAEEKLTPLGRALSSIPVDISIGKMLLMGCVFQQLQPVLTLAASLSVQTPFTNRAYRDHECETARKELESDHGDPITLLNAYKEWLEIKQAKYVHRSKYEQVENSKQWCRRRGLEEQRFYEMTKLRNQFQDLLSDCGLIEKIENDKLTSAERSIRHGELKQLRELRKAHKMEAPKRRKLLKSDPWGLDDNPDEGDKVDIRDVEFRLKFDASKMNSLVSGATACSYRDLMTLKLILVSGLYPQIAIADEFNYCKSPNEQFFHTKSKPYASLHPMSVFGNQPQVLQLTEPEIEEQTGIYKSRLPLSSKHQLICYLNLLETTKPYLMHTLRMPAAQTLLLFAHTIDTNVTMSRLVCDTWLLMEFPVPEAGQALLLKASNLRRTWNKLLEMKLENTTGHELANEKTKATTEELEYELWQNLANYMNTEVCYTLKRLLPGDMKTIYVGPFENVDLALDPNPFADDFQCLANSSKGGVYITENIIYGCLKEVEWSLRLSDEIASTPWECANCGNTFSISGLDKLQHKKACVKIEIKEESDADTNQSRINLRPNSRKYECNSCNKVLHLTSIEILQHKKVCGKKSE